MSLLIDPRRVNAVMVAGQWWDVQPESFDLDSYEYGTDDDELDLLHGGGQSGVCATGYTFKDSGGNVYSGPLTEVQMVRQAPRET